MTIICFRSSRTSNYHLCQACFWTGNIATEHRDDVFKEYNSFKPSSSGRSTTPSSTSISLKKSLGGCVQNSGSASTGSGSGKKSSKKIPKFPEQPEKTMDLSNLVPQPPTGVPPSSAAFMPVHPASTTSTRGQRSASSASNPASDYQYYNEYDDPYLVRNMFYIFS